MWIREKEPSTHSFMTSALHYCNDLFTCPLTGLQQRIETNQHFGAAESCVLQRKHAWSGLTYNLFLIEPLGIEYSGL